MKYHSWICNVIEYVNLQAWHIRDTTYLVQSNYNLSARVCQVDDAARGYMSVSIAQLDDDRGLSTTKANAEGC